MRVVVQRCRRASVTADGVLTGSIDKGFMLLIGFTHDDTKEIIDKMIRKIINLRVFTDENDKMNLNIKDVNGSILSISQFTLYADTKKSRRPSFTNAAKPDLANELYEYFIEKCTQENIKVEHGIFGADMKVELLNDGPVTIILEK